MLCMQSYFLSSHKAAQELARVIELSASLLLNLSRYASWKLNEQPMWQPFLICVYICACDPHAKCNILPV